MYLLFVSDDGPWICVVDVQFLFQCLQKHLPGALGLNFHNCHGYWKYAVIRINSYSSQQLASKFGLDMAAIQADDWPAATKKSSLASI